MGQVREPRDEEASPRRRPVSPSAAFGLDRFTLGIVVGALVLVAALFVVVLAQPKRAEPMDEARPAGVIHNYYLALLNDDPKTAYGYLSAEAQRQTPYEQFAREVSGRRSAGRIRIDEERIEGDTARVTVRRISGGDGGFFPFSSREYSYEVTFLLRLEGGAWKLAPSQPHGFYGW